MPLPLKPGYNFNVDRQIKNSDYEMKSMEIYRDYYGISYTVSGNRKFITPNSICFLHSGSIGITSKNVYHRTSFVDNEPYERFVVKFTDDAIKPLIDIIGQNAFDELYSKTSYHFAADIQDRIFKIFCDMDYEFSKYDVASDLILRGMLFNLLITIYREKLSPPEESIDLTNNDKTIIKAMHYIDGNFVDDPSMEQIAEYVNLSVSYFSKLFKKITGSTYSTYMNHVKTEHARQLLVKTDLSVSEIATLSGFSNGNYLCDVMKRIDGYGPKELRKRYITF